MAGSPPLRSFSFGGSSSQSAQQRPSIRSRRLAIAGKEYGPERGSIDHESHRKAPQFTVRIRFVSRFECTSKQAQGFVLSFPLFRPFKVCLTSRGDECAPRAEGGATRRYSTVVYTVRRGCSSAGRAPALQAGGRRFESAHLHQHIDNRIGLSRSPECRKAKLDPLSNLT